MQRCGCFHLPEDTGQGRSRCRGPEVLTPPQLALDRAGDYPLLLFLPGGVTRYEGRGKIVKRPLP